MTCSGYVLAGGRSSRMGRDKARLPFRGGDLAGAVAAAVASAAGNVTLVGHLDLAAIPDRYPGEGPLGGILTALHHTSTDWNLIVACDMPQVSATFLGELLARAMRSSADVLLPCGPDGLPQPLCAVYHRRALAALEDPFARGVRKVTAALAGLAVERLEVAELSLFQNVNAPEDWAAYAAK
ncbi:MAG: molybdenum cofactor guanylyltransferase [Candidatus Solibacter sp.]|nr:molybdenum cofactor guanylyltransferase [Candidatus Solibacter sp.]